jgi:mannose-6-phosphate isomerase
MAHPIPGAGCTLYPLVFQPLFKERVWGGRNLERLYRKPLPPGVPIGESWEISDRAEGVSVVSNGPLAGQTLRGLMEHRRWELLATAQAPGGRFPLLVKILDAEETLSLQVHPPAHAAPELGGEPKTELWYVAQARPEARLFAGLRPGTRRADFARRVADGTVAECFHQIGVQPGDAMFLPSGRVHALGGGLVVFEIQQNSDTTYRVHDWNRVGLDGRPRELHIEQSLACIDFDDFEPGLVSSAWRSEHGVQVRTLVEDPLFTVDLVRAPGPADIRIQQGQATILGVLDGAVDARGSGISVCLEPGGFCLLPAVLKQADVRAEARTELLRITPG